MSGSLASMLGLGRRELVAFTGAGGKSTLMLRLGAELAEAGKRVLITTTTKMGRSELDDLPGICHSDDPQTVTISLQTDSLVGLVTGGDDHKATGPLPTVVDALYESVPVDYLLVEADGAHGRSLKAPGSHEPVIPSEATTVVVLMGLDAVGGRIADVAHRPEQAATLTGLDVEDRLAVEHCVAVLTHPDGGRKGVPPNARLVVALTAGGSSAAYSTARQLSQQLSLCERISRVVMPEIG